MTNESEQDPYSHIITEEMIEKAARAIFASGYGNPPAWETASFISQGNYRLHARAALTAVLPEVIEKCAKVADGQASEFYQKYDSSGDHVFFKAFSFAMELGESIRCLIPAKSPH